MTDLDHAESIMALPRGSWIMAIEPVTVCDMQQGGTIALQMGARVKLTFTTRLSAFGYTEDARHVSFGMAEAVRFDHAKPDRLPSADASR